jgi:ABC-type molybdate transport system ATPase subunit
MAAGKTLRRPTQVNVRLTIEESDVLAALVFLEESSAAEVLRPVITAFLAQQRKDQQVQRVLQALEERRGRKSGRVAALRKPEHPPRTGA